jgi:hypothetical protein
MTSTYNDGLTISLYSVAFGDVPKHSAIRKFGETICLVANTEYTVCNIPVTAPVTTRVAKLTVHEKLKIKSTSIADSPAGSGARTLYFSGLDGVAEVITTNSYIHIRDLYVLTGGSTAVNQGDITVFGNTTNSYLGMILALQGGIKSNVYVVPKNMKSQYTLHNVGVEKVGGVASVADFRLLLWNKERTAYREHLKVHIDQSISDWKYIPLPHGIIMTVGMMGEWISTASVNNTPVRLISHVIEREA